MPISSETEVVQARRLKPGDSILVWCYGKGFHPVLVISVVPDPPDNIDVWLFMPLPASSLEFKRFIPNYRFERLIKEL